MRNSSNPLLFPPDDDRLDTRPRGISGATITSWDGQQELDPDVLFSQPGDQVSLAGAASAPVSAGREVVADAHKDEQLTFVTPSQLPTVAII